jgi:hypothetical protein
MMDDQAMDTVIRDAIHDTSATKCVITSDTCPDWKLAHEIGDALRFRDFRIVTIEETP